MRAKAPILVESRSYDSHTILLGNNLDKRGNNSFVFLFLRMIKLKYIFIFYNDMEEECEYESRNYLYNRR